MQQISMFSKFIKISESTSKRAHHARSSRIAWCSIVALFAMTYLFAPAASAQVSAATSTSRGASVDSDDAQSAADDFDDASNRAANNEAGTDSLTKTAPLSSDQIIQILQQNPDLAEELKSQVADRLQLQGMQLNASDISDQMLYDQIESNASLRASITTVLRARGYVSNDDLQSATTTPMSSSGTGALSSTSRSVSVNDASNPQSAETSAATGRSFNGTTSSSSVLNNSSGNGSPSKMKRRQEQSSSSTDLPKVIHQTPPYDLRAMHDLYAQIPEQSMQLKRFGSEVFINRNLPAANGVSTGSTSLDVPVGPDYIVGPGDTLTIALWGGTTQNLNRIVDRDGHILLPEAGSLQIGGLSLAKAEQLIAGALKRQYRDAQVAVTVSRLRSVRVYVVGDVQRPGGYDISSLATPLSALYIAGGPTSVGSLRIARHYRGKQLIEEIDLYDFLLHGIRNGSAHFESGDTLLVPPAGQQISISGAVKRPAIYELKEGESTLDAIVDDAGGFTAAASPDHIAIERIGDNHKRETVTLNTSNQNVAGGGDAIHHFVVKDGDRIRVEPILPYSQRAIYLTGHVARPGRWPYKDGMRLSDVLHGYRDMLPEPASHGEIVRLVPPDLHAETIDFDLADVLIGNTNVDLQPFDTIRIFGRYQVDAPMVSIQGEVLRPGSYPMSNGMTAAQLVRMAGGFKRAALIEAADLTSYSIQNGNLVKQGLVTVSIGAAVSGTNPNADVPLKPGDILTIHQITGWNDIGQSLQINGQVKYPGTYGFQEGERLSSVLKRAGGLLPTAYPMGAILLRDQVRDLEQTSRDELIRQIETNSAAARLSPTAAGSGGGAALQLIKAQQEQVVADLKSHPPTGRMVIHISEDIDSWANTPADIELRRGDVLTIPKRPGFVLVTGQVYNATALTFIPDQTANWYLRRAGGTNSTADKKEIFIIRANGSVVGRHSNSGLFDGSVLSTKLNPGDVVVVPQKIIGASLFWKNLLTTGQLAASIAITAGVAAATL